MKIGLLALGLPAMLAQCAPSGCTPTPGRAPYSSSSAVIAVRDGETVMIDGYSTPIRLIGVDTPDEGHCGYDEAKAAMEELVLGREVVVSNGAFNMDQNSDGELMRYIDVPQGGEPGVFNPSGDSGRDMIARGLAVATSEGRDGYTHLRQDDYSALDATTPGPDPACYQ